ncbi:hypothetical protein QBE54_10540 [Thermatribacter velox]|uniref:GHMP kinase N-terminal domain-containing protein n=1 Tax=Thermatribacter velox TaxID=3039681 RepID=A0ABZ2YAG8_9BACT
MVRALSPGSMGELFQGYLEDTEILVSLTIARYSEMEVFLQEKPFGPWQEEENKEYTQRLWKSARALEIALSEWGFKELRGKVSFKRRKALPEGKGFASSTADIAALLGALSALLKRKTSEEEIARIALRVEPTDSTLFSDFCVFDHISGKVVIRFPVPVYLGVVVCELPGKVETVEVDRTKLRKNWLYFAKEVRRALDMIQRGLEEGDLSLIGRAATLSGSILQEVNRERLFDLLREEMKYTGALGVNRAHTGKAVGVLFDRRVYSDTEMLRRVKECLQKEAVSCWVTGAVRGGVRIIRP